MLNKAFVQMIFDELCRIYGRQRAMRLLHRTVLNEAEDMR